MTDPIDLSTPRAFHVVAVGGAGMSAIATVLVRMGHTVSGSDLRDSAVLRRLEAQGVRVAVGHAAAHVPRDCDAIMVSTAVPRGNPEVQAAHDRGVPVLTRAEALRLITTTRRGIAVSGTHGKTTTASMLALILRHAGWAPSFIIGGEVNDVGGNAAYDGGEWLVVEADESDGTFVELEYEVAVVTNVEPDHLEHWGGFENLTAAFGRFVGGARVAVVCLDDPGAAALGAGAVTYGFDEGAVYRIADYVPEGGGSLFGLVVRGELVGNVALPVPGRHHALDAVGAAATAMELGVPFTDAAAALAGFGGVSRRFQFRGEVGGRAVVDDYAHLPTEIRAAVSAAREGPWGRVVAVFQPHRFSRTESLWPEFAGVFDDADVVVLTDVYAAGEAPRPGVSGRLVLQAVVDAGPRPRVVYVPKRSELPRYLSVVSRPGDVVLTLGAGDVTSLADEWRSVAGG